MARIYKLIENIEGRKRFSRYNPKYIITRIFEHLIKSIKGEIVSEYMLPNGQILSLPVGHALPFILARFPKYAENLKELANECGIKYHNNFSIIDIGANVGDSVLIIDKNQAKIYCIEGDDFYYKFLELNTIKRKNVVRFNCFIGAPENNNGNYEVIRTNGSASLLLTSTVKKHSWKTLSVLTENVAPDIKLVKIDTDGFDGFIIKESIEWLEKFKPILFFEFDPLLLKIQNFNPLEIFELLKKCGYIKLLFYEKDGRFMEDVKIIDTERLTFLTSYFDSSKNGKKNTYSDVCAFSESDNDIYLKMKDKNI